MSKYNHSLISDLRLSVYFSGTTSLFRHYQHLFLERNSRLLCGSVLEVGGELKYNHQRFFAHAKEFKCSNIGRDYDFYLDITKMDLPDNSQDAIVCVSVLEHVFKTNKAIEEIERVLKPGGRVLITIPFGYPYHDEVDYWRLSIDAYYSLLGNFEILSFNHLGGLFARMADNLKRPKEKWTIRYSLYKLMGLVFLLVGKRMERLDGFPLGYGIVAQKNQTGSTTKDPQIPN